MSSGSVYGDSSLNPDRGEIIYNLFLLFRVRISIAVLVQVCNMLSVYCSGGMMDMY